MRTLAKFSRHFLILLLLVVFWTLPSLVSPLPKENKASSGAKVLPPAQKQSAATQAPRRQPVFYDDANINATTPQTGGYCGIGAQRVISAGVPYVDVRVGHPESAGGNNHMRRQVKSSGSGVVHMVYRVFDSDTNMVVQTAADSNRNGFYFYNAYDCGGSNALLHGSEDVPMEQVFSGDTRPRKFQLGGIFVQPGGSNIPVAYGSRYILRTDLGQAGRYNGSPWGLAIMKDSAECLGGFTMDTSQTNQERANHPVMWPINESTYVAVCYRTGFPNLGRFWATTDRGLTWTGPATMGTASAWYNSFELTGSGNDVYFVSMTDPNDLTAFVTTERPVYVKVTYDPVTGTFSGITSPPIDIPTAAGYYDTGFLGTMLDIAATMVGDTLHVAWMTWNNWQGQNIAGPGGQVLHAQVFPDGTVPSVDKIADVNIDGRMPGYGCGFDLCYRLLPWSQIELSYDETNQRLYCLWVQPVPDNNPNDANYDWGDYEATGTLAVEDIFMSVSPNNGRGWDEAQNVTQTNNPGCDGSVGDECQHEYWFSCDDRVSNDTIWMVALVNKYPGIQEAAIASQITPDVGPQTAYRDVFRLYKVPARAPVLTAHGALGPAPGDTVQPHNIRLLPGSLAPFNANMQLKNIGLLDFVTDSIRIGADLNTSGLVTTSNFAGGNLVLPGGGYNFKVFLDASAVTPAQAGAHSGIVQVFGHSTSPVTTLVVCQAFNLFIIPSLCLNRKIQIHSATNYTDVGTQGSIKDQAGYGMHYPAISNRDNFYDGGVWIANSDLNAAEGVPGVPRKVTRQLFADKFLRCLADGVLDSTPGTGAYYNLSLSSISTDLEDSTLVFKHIWEQSTHPDSSDFLLHTVRVINIGVSPIDSVAMGCAYDIDVASDISNPPQNVSGDTTVSFLGKTWWLGWTAGNDVAIDTCSPNSEMYGVVIIDPDSLEVQGSPSHMVRPRGAVMYDQAGFAYNTDNSNEGGGDSLCQRYMWNLSVLTSTRRRDHDTLTGVWQDTTQPPPYFICGNPATGAPYRADEGYLVVAKKVYNFPVNTGGGVLVARYGLDGLTAGTDSAFKGLGETYAVIHLASNNGMAELITNAQKGIDWYLKHANYQAGPYQDVGLRGDFNNDRLLTPADAVAELGLVFLGHYPSSSVGPYSDCVADVNLDGIITTADYVHVLNRVYLGPPNCPWCLTRCP